VGSHGTKALLSPQPYQWLVLGESNSVTDG
jgi:hypothetical protein